MVIKVSDKEYNMFLRPDSNTCGHMQWFYFKVRNECKSSIRFNICNNKKNMTLYQRVCILLFREWNRLWIPKRWKKVAILNGSNQAQMFNTRKWRWRNKSRRRRSKVLRGKYNNLTTIIAFHLNTISKMKETKYNSHIARLLLIASSGLVYKN